MGEKLEVIITATDKASSVLSNIGKIGGGLLKAGLLAGGAALGGLAAGLGYAVSEAMEAQESLAQLDAVLKSTGGAAGVSKDMALDLADSLSQVTRFSDEAVLGGENMLLTFTNIGKDVFPEATTAMLDMSQALGQDIKSSAIQLGKALNDPVQGITALQRVGVSFTDEQKKMVEGMVEAGDVMGAQKFILAELQKEFGGSAEAAGQTFAGQLDILKNSLSNVAESVGMALLPLLQTLMDNVIIPIVPYIQAFAEGLSALFAEFQAGVEQGGLLGGVMEVLDNFLSDELIATIWEVIDSVQIFIQNALAVLIPWFQDMIPKAIAFLSDVWQTVFVPALQFVWNFISTILMPLFMNVVVPALQVIIPAAIQVLSDFWTNVLKPAITAVWSWMNTVLMPFLQTVVVPWLEEHIPAALQTLSDFWTNVLKPAIEAVWNWMTTVLMPFLRDTVVPFLQVTFTTALQVLSDFWTNVLKPAIETVWSWISTVLMPFLRDTVVPFLDTTFTAAIQVLSDFWTLTLKPALEAVWAFTNDYILPVFQLVIDIAKILGEIVLTALAGYWKDTLKPALETVWAYFNDNILPILRDVRNYIADEIGPKIQWFTSNVVSALSSAMNSLKSAINWVIEKLKILKEWLDKIKIPDDLSPGSPTPFELGIRGITDALIELNSVGMPAFMGGNLSISPAIANGGGFQPAPAMAGAQITIYGGLTLHGVQRPEDLLSALSEYMV